MFGGNYSVVPLEQSLGRKLAIVRLYYFVGNAFPGNAKYQKLLAHGRTVLVIHQMESFVTRNSLVAGAMYWDTHVGNCNYKVDAFLRPSPRSP